jgi:hypothetical protein
VTLRRASRQAARELERRRAEERARNAAAFTPEAIAAGHVPQLELIRAATAPDGPRDILALCSRRAGKSNGNSGILALDARDESDDAVQLYFGATKPAVRLMIWEVIWLPFCRR